MPLWENTPALDAVVRLPTAERVLLSCESFFTWRIVFEGIGKLGIELRFVSLLRLVPSLALVGGGKKECGYAACGDDGGRSGR
jgi:hypothetical protein